MKNKNHLLILIPARAGSKRVKNKNMKQLKGNVVEFQKTAKEAHMLNQRLTGLYEDIGHVLNRYYEIDEIKFTDVLKKGDFWAGLIMGTMFGFLAIGILWSIFRLISGNDPAWDFMNDETGNFIVFLAFIIAGNNESVITNGMK